jgi:ferredoxin
MAVRMSLRASDETALPMLYNVVWTSSAPDVFEVRADDFLYILAEHPADDRRDACEEAVRPCPTQAISIAED